MKPLTNVLQVTHQQQNVAKVVLNGYNIQGDGPLGPMGDMRSFKIITGELHGFWQNQVVLNLHNENGSESSIRVAAIPVEDDGYGLIEFL